MSLMSDSTLLLIVLAVIFVLIIAKPCIILPLQLDTLYLEEMFPECLYPSHFPCIMHRFVPCAWN